MKISNKLIKLNEFSKEPNSEKEKDSIEQNPDLSKEIDTILDKLKELELSLDTPADQDTINLDPMTSEKYITEDQDYDAGYESGKSAISSAKGAVIGTIALGVGAVMLLWAERKAKKNIKKRLAEYAKYYPKKERLEVEIRYSNQLFDIKHKKQEIIDQKIGAFKEKIKKKLETIEDADKKAKIREVRDSKIDSLKAAVEKAFDLKKEKWKGKLEKDLVALQDMWKVTESETDFRGFFEKLQKTEGPSKMSRLWEEGRIAIEEKEDPNIMKLEEDYINQIYEGDEDLLAKNIENWSKKTKEELAEKNKTNKAVIAELKKEQEKAKKDQQNSEKEKKKEDKNPKYKEAMSAENDFIRGAEGFDKAIASLEKTQSEENKEALKKAWSELQSLNSKTGNGGNVAKEEGANEEAIDFQKGRRKAAMDHFEQQYKKALKTKKTEPKKESKSIKLTKSIKVFEDFLNKK